MTRTMGEPFYGTGKPPEQFRAARKQLGLTQKGLALALRMGAHGWQSISKWERDTFAGEIPGPITLGIDCLLKDQAAQQGRQNARA